MSFLLWVVALVAVLRARPRWAQLLMLVPLICTLLGAALSPQLIGPWAWLTVQIAVLAGLTGLTTGVPIPGRGGWITTTSAAAAALSVPRFLPQDWAETRPTLTAATVALLAASTVAAVTGILGALRFSRLPRESYDIGAKA